MVIDPAESPALEIASVANARRIRLPLAAIPAALLFATSCAPAPSPVAGVQAAVKPAVQTRTADRYVELRDAAARSEAILTARVLSTDFTAPAADGFLSTLRVQVDQVLRGQATVGQTLCIRIPVGQEANGQWRVTAHTNLISDNPKSRVEPGQQLLLFVSRSYYEVQAKARRGEALPKCIAAPFGMARVRAGTISTEHLAYDAPATVSELQQVLEHPQ